MPDESVFVVIPAYNEAAALPATLQSLLKNPYQLVVVDDCSRDETWALLERYPVYAIRHGMNLGQGAALQTGTTFALSRGAAYIVHFDADGQHRAEDIETLLAPLRRGEADVALGSRFMRPEDVAQVPRFKRLLLRSAVLVDWALTGIKLTDAHNGFRALNRRAAQAIELQENRYAHATEILAQIHTHRLRYVECPTHIVYSDYARAKGQSVWNALNIVIDVLLQKAFR
jgi:glycosyltransferase involved in cell wall biosynthesis